MGNGILPDGTRKRARLFSALQSHYLFHDRYGRPGKLATAAYSRQGAPDSALQDGPSY